jgi:trans-aconitate methyltransferase
MATPAQPEGNRPERFAAYIEARRFDPPRPLLVKAAALVARKQHALDAGAGALNATRYLLSAGFHHVTALDASPSAEKIAAELPPEQVSFVLSRFEDFAFPAGRYDLVNAEFSLPFIRAENFPAVFSRLLRSIGPGGIFTGQLFGLNDSWNVPDRGMNFHARAAVEMFLRDLTILELEEEDHLGQTKLGEVKHWHIFHITARNGG